MTILQLVQGSHILAFTDSSSALGWMHKASFDPVNAESHDAVAQWLGWTLVSNETSLYSQYIKETENTIADSLSRDFHKLDIQAVDLAMPLEASRLPLAMISRR